MIQQSVRLQDNYLNQIRKKRVPVIIYLMNGVQLRGLVRGFDNFTLILETDAKHDLIYKHAISTITPQKPFYYQPGDEPEKEEKEEEEQSI